MAQAQDAGARSVTQGILDSVNDVFGRRYHGPDLEQYELRLQLAMVESKNVRLAERQMRVGIDQLTMTHLDLLLRTPEPGTPWPTCASEPGCCAEALLRSCATTVVHDFVQQLPEARLRVYLNAAEVQQYRETNVLPLDAPSRRCVACILNWHNTMVMQCQVAGLLQGLGCTFEQRISMFEGPERDGVHRDWLMPPGQEPFDRLSGFVAPMPYFAAWAVVPRLVRDAHDLPIGVRLDPSPMRAPFDKVSARVAETAADAEAALQLLADILPVRPLVVDVCRGRYPRTWTSLAAWQTDDPTLISDALWASTSPTSSAPCRAGLRSAVFGTAAVVMQRTKEWLASVPFSNALVLRRWIHYRQAQLLEALRDPPTSLDSLWLISPATRPLATPCSSTLTTSTPKPSEPDPMTATMMIGDLPEALPALPNLLEALQMHCPLHPSDLLRRPSELALPQQILHHLMVGTRSKATRLLQAHAYTLPVPVLEALVDDRADNLPRFDCPLRQRFCGLGLAPLEIALTLEQRVYVWLAIASYLGEAVWMMKLRRPLELALMDAYWALHDANRTCKNRSVHNKPLLAALLSPNDIKLANRRARRQWRDARPPDMAPDEAKAIDALRWCQGAKGTGLDLQTQYRNKLPVITFVHEALLNHQMLRQAEDWARPKVVFHCLACGYTSQDQSREYNRDRREKSPMYRAFGDVISIEYCRWCLKAGVMGPTIVTLPLAGVVVQVGTHAWIMCTRCGQQVSVRNSTFHPGWEVTCLWCTEVRQAEHLKRQVALGLSPDTLLSLLGNDCTTRACMGLPLSSEHHDPVDIGSDEDDPDDLDSDEELNGTGGDGLACTDELLAKFEADDFDEDDDF